MTSATDPIIGLNARDDWLYCVAHWNTLRAQLRPGGGNAQTGVVATSGEKPLPIDVHVSDLMREIEDLARFYGQILIEEVQDDAITTSAMPGLLEQVARRYGHFTEDESRMSLDFCDDAHTMREKVRKAVEKPAPAVYVGPCRTKGPDGDGCTGELYVGEGRTSGTCRTCGTEFTLADQHEYLQSELATRLMTPAEIARALKTCGHEVQAATVFKWAQRGRIQPAEDGLYLFAEALDYVRTKRGAA